LNRVVNVGQIISKLCFKQSLFNDLVLADSLTHDNLEMFAKSMKRFNLHTPVTNVQAQI
jgi:hypothetical protein